MSARLGRRRTNSSAGPSNPNGNEVFSTDGSSVQGSSSVASNPRNATIRSARALSSAGLSSSFSLPSRSYIHQLGHGSQEPLQYASTGVREQTEQLSSSFLSESDISSRFGAERRSNDVDSGTTSRTHDPIEERSEPVSPTGSDEDAPPSSELTAALRPRPTSRSEGSTSSGPDMTRAQHLSAQAVPEVVISEEDDGDDNHERTPLLPRAHLSTSRKPRHGTLPDLEQQSPPEDTPISPVDRYPSIRRARHHVASIFTHPKQWNFRELGRKVIYEPACMVPAVFLGLLLNLLDALSYGIILFPLGEEAFKDLGPDGVSMFYVSCIISQLVYSSGSIFKGGVGSEMIEVVPFFHKMTYMIMGWMGTGNPAALRATVITSYAMSSIITGLVFFGLGAAKLGTLVNFFPHSILTGCIGGVGVFLFITGIEVSARLDGNLELSIRVLEKLFSADTVVLWIPPLILAIILLTVKHFYDRPWLVPAYYIGITAIFYVITTAVPSISMENLRNSGWVFQAPAAGVPFYNFYSHYNFKIVDWQAIWMTIPSQLALTFFGILHVPINVPNLAMVVQEDNVSINRELIMHGVSNTLSGCVGSIQNYLVFVNSVLFINTGANSRLAGFMLAAATFGLWVAGPVVIGFVPVMVVGTLIYQLGIELAMEALVTTYGRLHRLEYLTIVVIALVMGMYDFVVGIAIGIGMACLVYVVQTSRKTVVRAEFSGTVAESTVRRHPRHRNYLHKAGRQIRIVKLGSYLFFGSIVKVEKKVRAVVEAETFSANPIRYLILDFTHVTGIDFSAAEAFTRMNRILHRREVKLAIAGVNLSSEVGKSLAMVDLFADDDSDGAAPAPKLYEDLNGALEACENDLLMVLTGKEKLTLSQSNGHTSPPLPIPADHLSTTTTTPAFPAFSSSVGSPRRRLLDQAATTILTETPPHQQPVLPATLQPLPEPLPLLLQAFAAASTENQTFWSRAIPYFTRSTFPRGTVLYDRGDSPDAFYLLQSGILRAEYELEQGAYHESIVAGTTCGELPFFSETERTSRVVAERDCVVWGLGREDWERLQREDGALAGELLKVGLRLTSERMRVVTCYVLISAS